ncbi:MAG: flagellar hook-length control protein FliK, partial [Chromatiaceae bacterium]
VQDDGASIDATAQAAGAEEASPGLAEPDGSSAVGVRASPAPASPGPRPYIHPVGLAGSEGPVPRSGAERPQSPGGPGVLVEPQMVLGANDPDWSGDLGERVLWLIGRRESLAELHLDPPDLGSLEIRVRHERDATSVHFLVQSGAARDLLESALPRLRELFGEAGLSLQHLEVSERQPGRHGGGQDSGPGGGHAWREEESSAIGERPRLRWGRGEGLIDTYA